MTAGPSPVPVDVGAFQRHLPTVMEVLKAHGWIAQDTSTLSWGGWVASKEYQTAVGPKSASVFLYDPSPDSDNLVLSGDYRSEGSNVLHHAGLLFRKDADADEIRASVARCLQQADDLVQQSYAVRLLNIRTASDRVGLVETEDVGGPPQLPSDQSRSDRGCDRGG